MTTVSEGTTAEEIRHSVPDLSHRAPKHMTFNEIEAMPRLEFTRGCESGVFVSKERDGARYFSQGLCFHASDMDDLTWQETGWDEAFLCLKGKLLVIVEDAEGNTAEWTVEQGDHFWAPAGFKYTLRASGVESINFWTMGPVMKSGWRYTDDNKAPAYSEALIKARGEA